MKTHNYFLSRSLKRLSKSFVKEERESPLRMKTAEIIPIISIIIEIMIPEVAKAVRFSFAFFEIKPQIIPESESIIVKGKIHDKRKLPIKHRTDAIAHTNDTIDRVSIVVLERLAPLLYVAG